MTWCLEKTPTPAITDDTQETWDHKELQIDEECPSGNCDLIEEGNEQTEKENFQVEVNKIISSFTGIAQFEELENVVAYCPAEFVWAEYLENLTRRDFILPYKDGYLWYGYGWNGGTRGYYLTYRTLENPCERTAHTDEFFIWNVSYKYSKDEFIETEFPDNKVYIAEWWLSGIPMRTIAKELNCEAGQEDNTLCKQEVDTFMYNLIVWKENNEYFAKKIEQFKNSIDQENYMTLEKIFEYSKQCNESITHEMIDTLEEGEINQIIHECLQQF